MSQRNRLLALTLSAGCTLMGCSGSVSEGEQVRSVDSSAVLIRNMKAISGARILLGHQSVGRDVLGGLQSLSAETGVPLRIVEITGLPPDGAPGIFHSTIGRNGDPDAKCEVFAHLLLRPERPDYDLAMMKFCYVDLGADTPLPVAEMLDRYARMVRGLREQRPEVQLIHISLPLMADPPGGKTRIKRLLKRSTERDDDNTLRNAFNAGLRERYSGEPLFDLAAVESTRPDGSRSSFSRNGRTFYTLAQEYTHDGGHLNANGRRRAAVAFVQTLAEALPQG